MSIDISRREAEQLGSIAAAFDEARSKLGVTSGVRFLRKLPDGTLDQLVRPRAARARRASGRAS